MMISLQKRGCHNINFVTPTHFAPHILDALIIAVPAGLRIPLVYNCGGYEGIEMLRLLDGVIDIYMPDMKYGGGPGPARFSQCPDYFEHNKTAIREMYRQAGPLLLDDAGIAYRGLMIRHLVLPGGMSASRQVLDFIARELSPHIYISVMEQYFPAFKALDEPDINRRITSEEYTEVLDIVEELEFENGWIQGYGDSLSDD